MMNTIFLNFPYLTIDVKLVKFYFSTILIKENKKKLLILKQKKS